MKRKGFTLVELLLVITIISVLAAVVVPRFFGRSQQARVTAARQTIVATLGIALDMFEQDTGRYPRVDESLNALLKNPGTTNWNGPYIKSEKIPKDPWQNDYYYAYPSEITDSQSLYDLGSKGPDGVRGNNDDITNHNSI